MKKPVMDRKSWVWVVVSWAAFSVPIFAFFVAIVAACGSAPGSEQGVHPKWKENTSSCRRTCLSVGAQRYELDPSNVFKCKCSGNVNEN